MTNIHLIVDGYNIINKWIYLKKALEKNLEYARKLLIDRLTLYSDYKKDITVTVVFDGKKEVPDYYVQGTIDVIFTKGKSADAAIEEIVYNSIDKTKVLVATDDRKHQDMVFGMGAFYISSSGLKEEIDKVIDEVDKAIRSRKL